MRTTRKQVEGLGARVISLAIEKNVPNAGRWFLDYSSVDGGWALAIEAETGGVRYFGGDGLSANRLPTAAFYQSLRTVEEVLRMLP